jgi:RNA polymerase sigma factor (sigma-70 family)
MEGFLSPEEGAKLIPGVLSGDRDAQEKFYENYKRIIHVYAQKYFSTISQASVGMFQYEDIYQHLWLCVLEKLPKFDVTRANIVTWLYMVCYSHANMLYRSCKFGEYRLFEIDEDDEDAEVDENGKKRKKHIYTSINDTILDKDGDNIELLEVLIAPHTALESYIMSEMEIYNYVYILKTFISKLSKQQQMVYWHMIKGVSQITSANVIGLSQSYISRIKHRITNKALRLWETRETQKIDEKAAFDFAIQLMGKESDEDIADRLSVGLAVIKICREILNITDLHEEVS